MTPCFPAYSIFSVPPIPAPSQYIYQGYDGPPPWPSASDLLLSILGPKNSADIGSTICYCYYIVQLIR